MGGGVSGGGLDRSMDGDSEGNTVEFKILIFIHRLSKSKPSFLQSFLTILSTQ